MWWQLRVSNGPCRHCLQVFLSVAVRMADTSTASASSAPSVVIHITNSARTNAKGGAGASVSESETEAPLPRGGNRGGISRAEFAKAEREIAADRAANPPFPAEASGTGKRYYAFTASVWDPPFVAAGQRVALESLDGSWTSRGRAPCGFASIEDALNHISTVRGVQCCEVLWR